MGITEFPPVGHMQMTDGQKVAVSADYLHSLGGIQPNPTADEIYEGMQKRLRGARLVESTFGENILREALTLESAMQRSEQ